MPVRQATQGGINQPALTGYNSAGVAQARYREPTDAAAGSSSLFWNSLLGSAIQTGAREGQEAEARNYLEGQQDSLQGQAKQTKNWFVRQSYEQGFNKATVNTALAKFQLGLQGTAMEYVNAGKTPEEFNAHVQEQTDSLLSQAGAQGMDLQSRDWQTWLNSVDNTRNTASDMYQTANLKRSQFLKEQSIAAGGSAAIVQFNSAEQSGNPTQALENINDHVSSIYNDNTLSPQEKVQYTSQFLVSAFSSAQGTGSVQGISGYMQSLPEFQSMPTDVQVQLMNTAQQMYQQRASDESVKLYEYNSKVASVTDYNDLQKQFPMNDYIGTVMSGVQGKFITPATGYGMVDAENQRRAKMQKAQQAQVAYQNGVTVSDIATVSGEGLDKVSSNLKKMYAAAGNGYSGGGLALMQRGLKSGASDVASIGIEMLQQDAQGLNSIDWRNLKTDADGKPLYPGTVVQSLTNLNSAYSAAMAAGNQVQANQLLAGLPDAVVYGIRQGVDSRDLADVVGKRANDIAAGKVVALPAQMPREMLVDQSDVTAGIFDMGITSKARNRNLIGIQSWVFNSDADEKAAQARVNQINGAISNEYQARQQAGTLPYLSGDDLKAYLVGKVSERTVRVADDTDNGALLVLPNVGDKSKVFGTVDNNLIGRALKLHVQEFKKANPSASTVQMDYDPLTQEIIFAGTNQENVLGVTRTAIPVSSFRKEVGAQQDLITGAGQGNIPTGLSVPGVGYVPYSTKNNYGVQTNIMMNAVNQLVTYEGYTSQKGFSILDKHPETGAALNEAKYVKQATDTPQQAAEKLSMYVNDKVLPSVMPRMDKYEKLPGYLKTAVFNALVETTYHAGNADAFGKYIDLAMTNDGDLSSYTQTPLFKDAGAGSRRNRDRVELLKALKMYHLHEQNIY